MNFNNYSDDMLKEYIIGAKKRLGSRLLIPAHHYISRDIVEIADIIGDSYKLAVDVSRSKAEFIVFCGVRFMADGAKILASENQHILHPVPDAGCPMADMIDEETAEQVVEKIGRICSREIIPVVYMNSYADSKNFCGRRGGTVCTSSNAEKIVRYFLDKGKSIFFFPDFHLGINTANRLKIDESLIIKVGRDLSVEDGKDIKNAQIFLWDGYCPIHQEFNDEDVVSMRKKYPSSKVIVHPEVKNSVVSLSDRSGSTQEIFDSVLRAEDGSTWIIGTETTFVDRIAVTFPKQTIIPLKHSPCNDMMKINLKNTAEIIKSVEDFIADKDVLKNEVFVENNLRDNAKIALNRMIDIVEAGK